MSLSAARWVGVAALAAVVLFTGCWQSEPFSHAQVKGKVTYEDGSPIPFHHMRVIFTPLTKPLDPKTFPRPGEAYLTQKDNADGSFSRVTSHKPEDGLVVGKHKVHVIPLDENDSPMTKLVHPDYMDSKTTPIEVDTAVQPFEIKVKKPAGAK